MDTWRIDDSVLALLLLGLHGGDRVWKSIDWDALGGLHEQGHISGPVGKAQSVLQPPEGETKAPSLVQSMFGKLG